MDCAGSHGARVGSDLAGESQFNDAVPTAVEPAGNPAGLLHVTLLPLAIVLPLLRPQTRPGGQPRSPYTLNTPACAESEGQFTSRVHGPLGGRGLRVSVEPAEVGSRAMEASADVSVDGVFR